MRLHIFQTDPSVRSYAGPNESIADNDDAAAGQTVLPRLERIVLHSLTCRITRAFHFHIHSLV